MTTIDTDKFEILIQQIMPDAKVQSIEKLTLGFSNQSFRVMVSCADDTTQGYVVKWYSTKWGESICRAQLEYQLLSLLQPHHVPCPLPVFFDAAHPEFDAPILVTRLITGEQILAHPPNPRWTAKAPVIAVLLAQIHNLSCPDELRTLLPDTAQKETQFLEGDVIPDYMQAYADGETIWYTVQCELPRLSPVDPVLVHGDFWSGNMLWQDDKLTGLLDWERTSFGHRGIDVAYCRMEMLIDGMDESADTFLKTYEAAIGKPVDNLALCELVVAVMPMQQRAPYLTESPIQERYRAFVANAISRL